MMQGYLVMDRPPEVLAAIPLMAQEFPVSLEQGAPSYGRELIQGLAFPAVGVAWTVLDYLAHQAFDVTAGENTPPYYFRNKIIFGIPALVGGRILSDIVGGSELVRALTITTTANALLQLRYLFTQPADFNVAVFLIHEAILLPLSFLLTGGPSLV